MAYIQDILETFISTSEPETIRNMLTAIDQQRNLLAGILTAKGVEADVGETLNTLVAKVADISGGSQDKVGQAMVICDSAKKCVVGNASFTADIEG